MAILGHVLDEVLPEEQTLSQRFASKLFMCRVIPGSTDRGWGPEIGREGS